MNVFVLNRFDELLDNVFVKGLVIGLLNLVIVDDVFVFGIGFVGDDI